VSRTDAESLRRLRFFLRDHRVLTADARVASGQDLFTYITSRTRYMNLTGVEWLGTREHVDYMALKVDKILWAASEDGTFGITRPRAAGATYRVEIELEGGYQIAAGLLLIRDQRLSDYLRSAPPFIPFCEAELRPRGKYLGDVVVNQDAVQIVREARAEAAQPDDGALRPRAPDLGQGADDDGHAQTA
jgi:hypothetical protein